MRLRLDMVTAWVAQMLVVVLLCILAVALGSGCRSPYGQGANQVLHDPNSDMVRLEAQIAAIKAGQTNIPEQFSQMQDDGWGYYMREKSIARNPDDTPLLLTMPNGLQVPVYNEYESLGKWNLVNTLSGSAGMLGALEELEFRSGRWNPGVDGSGVVRHYASGRDGFHFSLKSAKGDIGANAETIRAKYEGQAAVKAALGAALGTTIERHWAGRAGLLKVAADGTVSVLREGREIAGVFLRATPLGLAASGLEQIAVTLQPQGQAPTTEVLTQPAQ